MNYVRLESIKLYLPVGGYSLRAMFAPRGLSDEASRILNEEGGRYCKALDDVSFELNSGDRVGLIGVNGAGKSSLLRVLAGIYQPTDGAIETAGRVSTLFAPNIGMNENASGAENIYISARTIGMSRAQIAAARDDIIRFADIGEFIDMPMRTYSAGMRMRLGFAIATAIEPEILLIDEVFGAGDAAFRARAQDRMKTLTDRAGIMVMATHSEGVIKEACNRVIWLEEGRIKRDGDPVKVMAAFKAEVAQQRKDALRRRREAEQAAAEG